MQKSTDKAKVWAGALAWVSGLLLAGSEGAWMPYLNCLGGLIFLGATLYLGKVLPRLDSQVNATGQKPPSSRVRECTEGCNRLTGKLSVV